jgi:gas vesicle protein
MGEQYHENSCSQLGGFLVGLLVGGLAGAGMMLLLAPQSGKKTRAGIEKKGKKLRKQFVKTVEETTAQVRTKAHQITDDVAEQAGDLQQRGQDAIDEQRDLLGDSLKDLGKAVHT